ncbi:hypothetical protein [Lapidilactobacillus salsurivasis]
MITEKMLYWNSWHQLTVEEQQRVFEQILRYFVNPLWSVENIKSLETPSQAGPLRTFEVNLNGQTYFFMPGQEAGTVVAELDEVAPFLMSVQALPSSLKLIGQLNLVNGERHGNQKLLKKHDREITAYLERSSDSLNPFASDNDLFGNHDLVFIPANNGIMHIFVQQNLEFAGLRRELRRDGANLPTRNQWEYAALANWAGSFAAIDDSQSQHQLGLGMLFDPLPTLEMLDDPAVAKENPFGSDSGLFGGTDTQVKSENDLLDLIGDVTETDFSHGPLSHFAVYRSVFNVQLD